MRKNQLRKLIEERIVELRGDIEKEDVTDAEWEFCVNADLNLLSDEQVLDNFVELLIITEDQYHHRD
jgi:hypothetical protein